MTLQEISTQIKLIANPSVITLEDIVNNWLASQTAIIAVIDIKQVKFSKLPMVMVIYQVQNLPPLNKVAFSTVTSVNKKRNTGK